jgi:hypothetical protein
MLAGLAPVFGVAADDDRAISSGSVAGPVCLAIGGVPLRPWPASWPGGDTACPSGVPPQYLIVVGKGKVPWPMVACR